MLHRRTFLKATGVAALALPTILRAQNPPSSQTQKPAMEIKRIGSQPSLKGPADWFTGTVRIDPLFDPNASARAGAATVTFEQAPGQPGTRILSARGSSSRQAVAAHSERAAQSKRFAPAMSSGFHLA